MEKEENKKDNISEEPVLESAAAEDIEKGQPEKAEIKPVAEGKKGGAGFKGKSAFGLRGGNKKRGGKFSRDNKDKDGLGEEFEQRIVDIARVTRVMAGGKRMRFRACVAVGNKKGRVAIGLAKGADVSIAVQKAVNKAKKKFIDVVIVNETIPYAIYHKKGAAKILLKPARKGRGVIAGGVARIILELAGIKNITSKILGTNNKINNVKCVIEALQELKKKESREKDNNESKKKV
jgi:small subunit ribosomal protein S5